MSTTGKRALISGITGQDGSYLAELLLAKGYEVHGIIRRSSSFNTGRIEHIYQDPHEQNRRLHLIYGDLNDASSLNRILKTVRPDEISTHYWFFYQEDYALKLRFLSTFAGNTQPLSLQAPGVKKNTCIFKPPRPRFLEVHVKL